jgi:hypothetical protein
MGQDAKELNNDGQSPLPVRLFEVSNEAQEIIPVSRRSFRLLDRSLTQKAIDLVIIEDLSQFTEHFLE